MIREIVHSLRANLRKVDVEFFYLLWSTYVVCYQLSAFVNLIAFNKVIVY